eukprot:6197310-Pleurochrysis_carterae.AAC.2
MAHKTRRLAMSASGTQIIHCERHAANTSADGDCAYRVCSICGPIVDAGDAVYECNGLLWRACRVHCLPCA